MTWMKFTIHHPAEISNPNPIISNTHEQENTLDKVTVTISTKKFKVKHQNISTTTRPPSN